MKEKEEIFAVLDLGTSKICTLVGLKAPGKQMEIIGAGTAPSKGIKKGSVVDIERTAEAINQAVQEAEEMADVEISSLFVNISGNHIKSMNSYGSVPITNENYEISEDDAEKAINSAKAVSIPLERMVLHVISQDYSIDGQKGIREPSGMSGVKLEVGVHIITATIAAVQNSIKCISRAGFNYEEIVSNCIASSYSTLTEEEKEMGTVMIDIGAGTSDTSIFIDGNLKFSDSLPVGGDLVTNDVSSGLRIPMNKAEEIKKKYGSALKSNVASSLEFMVPGVLGRASQSMPVRDLSSIIEARLEETFSLIKQRIEIQGVNEKIGSGIVLTGGVSLLTDIDKLASKVFNVPVRIGRVRGVDGMDYILESPSFATSVGLLLYAEERKREKKRNQASEKKVTNLFFEFLKKFKKR